MSVQLRRVVTLSFDLLVYSGVTGAKAGTLSFLVGGSDAAFQLSSPILAYMGQKIIHCGPSGAGLAAKVRPVLTSIHHLESNPIWQRYATI